MTCLKPGCSMRHGIETYRAGGRTFMMTMYFGCVTKTWKAKVKTASIRLLHSWGGPLHLTSAVKYSSTLPLNGWKHTAKNSPAREDQRNHLSNPADLSARDGLAIIKQSYPRNRNGAYWKKPGSGSNLNVLNFWAFQHSSCDKNNYSRKDAKNPG